MAEGFLIEAPLDLIRAVSAAKMRPNLETFRYAYFNSDTNTPSRIPPPAPTRHNVIPRK
jgi:hypothetical protein